MSTAEARDRFEQLRQGFDSLTEAEHVEFDELFDELLRLWRSRQADPAMIQNTTAKKGT